MVDRVTSLSWSPSEYQAILFSFYAPIDNKNGAKKWTQSQHKPRRMRPTPTCPTVALFWIHSMTPFIDTLHPLP
jgi:hypothetical protein